MIIEQIAVSESSTPVIAVALDFLGFRYSPVKTFELETDPEAANQRRIEIAKVLKANAHLTKLDATALVAESTLLRNHLDDVNYQGDKSAGALNLYEENAPVKAAKVAIAANKAYGTLSN